MNGEILIKEIDNIEIYKDDLCGLVIQVVGEGASIGFLPPLSRVESMEYWNEVSEQSNIILYVATLNDKVVGSIQLHLTTKPNGLHRAEIAKLMTHPQYRRHGIGKLLMTQAEKRAVEEGRRLIVLDTREGDTSNHLYTKLNYQRVGNIPGFAKSANGEFHSTIIYYKTL